MKASATVFVVDDDAAVRDGTSLLLETEGFDVRTFESGPAFLQHCQGACAGCLILDVNMPVMDGEAVHHELIRRGIRLPVIYLTAYGEIPLSVRAMKAGALGFLTKPVTGSELIAQVREALEISARWQQEQQDQRMVHGLLTVLTEREREVLVLAVKGLHNKEIARCLGISFRTVEIHRARVMHKTGASSLLELARIAEAAGLVSGAI